MPQAPKTCRPVERAEHFLRRYALDTLERIRGFSRVRARGPEAVVLHGDARELELGGPFDGIVTSPPYPGLIDYHEQHRYAYELLGLDDRRELELGAAERGVSAKAIGEYVDGIAAVFANARTSLRPRRARRDRDQRPPRALPGDPRPRRADDRDALPAPRQSPHGPPRGRVLRGRDRRPLGRYRVFGFGTARYRHVSTWRLAWSGCSRAPSRTRSSDSRPAASRSRRISRTACPDSRSSGSRTARARRRSTASGAGSPRPSWSGRSGGSRSTSLPRRCGRRARRSTCRSRSRSWPRPGRSRGTRSRSTRPSASSRWTAGCDPSAECSRWRRPHSRRACRGCSAPRARRPRRRWPGSSRFPCGISPTRSRTCAASSTRSPGCRGTGINRRRRFSTSPI